MFDNKLYYQNSKSSIREYQYNYYYENADKWKVYSAKYRNQKKMKKEILLKYFLIWKGKTTLNVRIVKQPFII